jgi:iron(III) transport system permease protein
MTTKIWACSSIRQTELAAAAAVPLLLLTVILLQAQKFILGRRLPVLGGKYGPPRKVEMKGWRWVAPGFASSCC